MYNSRPGNVNAESPVFLRNWQQGQYELNLDWAEETEAGVKKNVFTESFLNKGVDVDVAALGHQDLLALTIETDPACEDSLTVTVKSAKLEYDLEDGLGVRAKWVDFALDEREH